MKLHLWIGGLFVALASQRPCLTFYSTAAQQPQRVEGVPQWRDSVFLRTDTLVVLHLRERRYYTELKADLKSRGTTLELRVIEDAGLRRHEGAVPGGRLEKAYEARIGPLSPGSYTLILRDDGYGASLEPFVLRRVIAVADH